MSSSPRARFISIFSVLFMLPAIAPGQQVVRLAEGCVECRIAFDTVAVLGETAGPGMIEGEHNPLEVDGHGRFYVLNETGSHVSVFSSDGSFLRRIGGPGDGPGEFRLAVALHVDSLGQLRVSDSALRRISVFNADGALQATIPVPSLMLGHSLLPMSTDSILTVGFSLSPDLVGYSAHMLDPDGELARSFGEKPYPITSSDPFYHLRTIAWADSDHIWIGGWDRYQLELWRLDGMPTLTLIRDADWFRRPEPFPGSAEPPRPQFSSLMQDSSGLVWTRLRVAAHEWSDGPYLRDTVVEVIDPARGVLLASARLHGPDWYSNIFGDRYIARTVVDALAGTVHIIILQMRLEGV